MFVENHLDEFKKIPFQEQKPFGNPKKFATLVLSDLDTPKLGEKKLHRSALKTYCANSKNTTLQCCLSISDWGGMRPLHGRNFFKKENFKKYEPTLDQLRLSKNSRKEDYKKIYDLEMKHIGVAFFTKFLFFLRPESNAYILDQWTAKSINLLVDPSLARPIKLSGNWVVPANDADAYENFCEYIDLLAKEHVRDEGHIVKGHIVEQMLFSKGGHSKGEWRKYVIENYPKALSHRERVG